MTSVIECNVRFFAVRRVLQHRKQTWRMRKPQALHHSDIRQHDDVFDVVRRLKKLEQMLTALGARDAKACIADPDTLCTVKKKVPVYLNGEGYITGMHAADIGNAAQKLGAGRAEKTDIIDPAVGLVMHKRRGDFVKAGEPVATMYVNDESRLEEAVKTLRGAIELGAEKPEHEPMVYDVIK